MPYTADIKPKSDRRLDFNEMTVKIDILDAYGPNKVW